MQLDAQACCDTVGITPHDGERPSVTLKRWLEQQTTPWLLVFDNAEDPKPLRPHLPTQAKTNHHIVITSRNSAWGGVASALKLDMWNKDQGANFLSHRLSSAAHQALRDLTHDLGDFPLALEQTGETVENYRHLLANIETGPTLLNKGK